MDLAEFEALVEGSEESQSLEFKGPFEWSIRTLVKDILALANVQDGGHIIVGFEDQTFERKGLTQEQADSFDLEMMQDQVSNFADPHVRFSVDKIVDANQLNIVVIKVHEFDEIPVICRRDGHDVHQGKMYYRSRRRRPESEPVSNSFELRDILDRAAVKIMSRRTSQGYTAQATEDRNFYDEELDGL